LARVARLSRVTGVLAFVPGGASAMVAMSPEVGADPRVVATVQYVRLVLVGSSASFLVALAQALGSGGPWPAPGTLELAAGPPAPPWEAWPWGRGPPCPRARPCSPRSSWPAPSWRDGPRRPCPPGSLTGPWSSWGFGWASSSTGPPCGRRG